VSVRTHEIGIRLALGAQQGNILAPVLRQGVWLLLAGETIGLLGAFALNRFLTSMVFGVTTTDGNTYVVVLLTWALAALLACYLPANHATKIDPLIALRCE
jgi:putative ABC transport system permease protein